MPQYKAPIRDMQFLIHEVFNAEQQYQALGYSDVNRDLIDAILTEGAKFTENELAPLRTSGDEHGVTWDDGKVTVPPGFKAAFDSFRDNGWATISIDQQWGGQGLPHSLNIIFHEMCFTANIAWGNIVTLTHGAIRAIEAHASDELKQLYLPKMGAAEWTGTMCLTEPHAGSDVGLVKTKAEPQADGSYAITGTKIFITQGENDYADNIIHLVLARLPGAPKGPKGISLFLVPKLLPDANGNPGARNTLSCASVEKKMGLKGAPACVMNFDGAKGWLVGQPNAGLACMFTMMNAARLDVGIEGLAASELAFQGAVEYARDRLQMRAPTGPVSPDKDADPIIHHPDVRRMLMTQKALTEGCRALAYHIALQLDVESHGDEAARKAAADRVALLTPINKAFLTDRGLECANLGVQVYGGHGYIREHGLEQIVRDVRIALLYEGTNGIQANDLVGRKLVANQGRLLRAFLDEVDTLCAAGSADPQVSTWLQTLAGYSREWWQLAQELMARASKDPNSLYGAAVEFQDYAGYVTLAYFWAVMAQKAADQLANGQGDAAYYTAKLKTARFYFERLLPRTRGLVETIRASADAMMDMRPEEFIL
ncbi:MAG: acyl-CoA dehydrogenase C-terminal domain-containing protein [Gammaproteobacteria bacterium]